MRPSREEKRSSDHSYFISTQTAGRRSFFQVEKWANLMVDVLQHYDGDKYTLHAYVVMPDHLHVLLTPIETLEKSAQLIKGGFSFRVKRDLGWNGEVWQPGFSDHRIRSNEDWKHHLEYIRLNPVEERLLDDSELYPWMDFPSPDFPQGLKPQSDQHENVRAEARTLHPSKP
jgi:putative transposase